MEIRFHYGSTGARPLEEGLDEEVIGDPEIVVEVLAGVTRVAPSEAGGDGGLEGAGGTHDDDYSRRQQEAEFAALREAGWQSSLLEASVDVGDDDRGILVREDGGGPQVLTSRVTFQFEPGVEPQAALEALRGRLEVLRPLRFAPRMFAGRIPIEWTGRAEEDAKALERRLDELWSHDLIAWIEPDPVEVKGRRGGVPGGDDQVRPLDRDVERQQIWQWQMLNLLDAWASGATGRGVEISVLDLGFSTVPELQPVSPWSAAFGPDEEITVGVDHLPRDNHGTWCAGMAAARNNGVGIQGVSFESTLRLIALGIDRTLHASLLARAIAYAVDPLTEVPSADIAPTPRVLTASVGPTYRSFRRLSRPTGSALDLARERQVPVFWSVSHDSNEASRDEVVAHRAVAGVGAVTSQKKYLGGAFGDALEFVAPGWGVVTTYGNGGWGALGYRAGYGGPSLASPCVAGVAALVLAESPSLTAEQLNSVLRETCERLGSPEEIARGRSQRFGFGIPNAARAVAAAAMRDAPGPNGAA